MCLRLTDLCVETIVHHFPRYNLEFKTTNDELTKLKYEFLQKRYSYDILTKLCDKDEPLKDYIDLLINKYLNILDISWFKECSWEKVTSKIAEIGPTVEKLTLQGNYFEEEEPWKDLIHYFPNLKCFIIRDQCHHLILLNVVIFCRHIEEIVIERGGYFRFDMSYIVQYLCSDENGPPLCTKLKKLFVGNLRTTFTDVTYLIKNLPSLEIFDAPRVADALYLMHKEDLLSVDTVKPYNIRELSILRSVHNHDDVLKICLYVCPYLQSLCFTLSHQTELNSFCKLSNLNELHIRGAEESDVNASDLLKVVGDKLAYLTIEDCIVSLPVLAESCPHIKNLTLDKVDFLFNDGSKPLLQSLISIKFARLDEEISDQIISSLLSSSVKLESLAFEQCHISSYRIEAHIMECCSCFPIKKIYFNDSAPEIEFIKELLLSCPTLSCLNIFQCFTEDELDELLKFAKTLANKPKINSRNTLDYRRRFTIPKNDYNVYDYDVNDY